MSSTVEKNFVQGSMWMIAMRWGMRLIGLVSTIILARLLDPFDFGMIAMAMIVTALLESITMVGVDLALIRRTDAVRAHYDTAWTIQILQGIALAAMLLIAAPYTESYFNEPQLVLVVQALSLKAFINGFANIGTVAFRKELNFALEFRFEVYKKLITFVVVISGALILGNYWAIVIALIVSAVLRVVLSYMMHPYRPRTSFAKLRDIWSFSFWLLISRIGVYLNRKTDAIIIGNAFGTNIMGIYHVGSDVGMLFSQEFVMPIRRALFPNFAKISGDEKLYRSTVRNMVGVLSVICASTGFGMMSVASDFTSVVLGSKWMSAVPVIEWLAVFGAVAGIALTLEVVLLASGHAKLSAVESWLQLTVLVPVLYFVASSSGLEDIAMVRMIIALLFLPLMIYLVTLISPVKFMDIISMIWRPTIAGLSMLFMVRWFHMDSITMPAVRLAMDIGIGIVSYFSVLYALWYLAGKSDGVERIILDKIRLKMVNERA
ncbi:MAG: lipopolysaccharide biosynthesis protein [Sedimenticola sp.]